MPLERELPESLQSLCRRQALELSDVHFARDVDLIEALKRPAGTRGARSPEWLKPTPIASISMVLALATGIGIWTWRNAHPPGQAIGPVVAGISPNGPACEFFQKRR